MCCNIELLFENNCSYLYVLFWLNCAKFVGFTVLGLWLFILWIKNDKTNFFQFLMFKFEKLFEKEF